MGGAPHRYRLPLRPAPDNVMSVGHITSIGERRPTSSHLTSLPSQTMSFTLELGESMTRMLPPRWESLSTTSDYKCALAMKQRNLNTVNRSMAFAHLLIRSVPESASMWRLES
jgi:hypothetical protein